jgi:hypothetical protein
LINPNDITANYKNVNMTQSSTDELLFEVSVSDSDILSNRYVSFYIKSDNVYYDNLGKNFKFFVYQPQIPQIKEISQLIDSGDKILISWKPELDVNDFAYYRIYYNDKADAKDGSFVDGNSIMSLKTISTQKLELSGLDTGVDYYINVVAVDENGYEGPFGNDLIVYRNSRPIANAIAYQVPEKISNLYQQNLEVSFIDTKNKSVPYTPVKIILGKNLASPKIIETQSDGKGTLKIPYKIDNINEGLVVEIINKEENSVSKKIYLGHRTELWWDIDDKYKKQVVIENENVHIKAILRNENNIEIGDRAIILNMIKGNMQLDGKNIDNLELKLDSQGALNIYCSGTEKIDEIKVIQVSLKDNSNVKFTVSVRVVKSEIEKTNTSIGDLKY